MFKPIIDKCLDFAYRSAGFPNRNYSGALFHKESMQS